MRDNKPLPPWAHIVGCALSLSLFVWHGSYVRTHGRLPGQINTWRPASPPELPFEPPANSFRVIPTLDGHVKVVPTLMYLENGKVLEGVPDAANCIQWRYRR